MGIRRFGTSGLSLLVVVGAVVALGAATEGCIYHEADDIVFPDPGHKWCTTSLYPFKRNRSRASVSVYSAA